MSAHNQGGIIKAGKRQLYWRFSATSLTITGAQEFESLARTNVPAELLARAYATVRKNFLFHESAEGARSAAIILTLIRTARANGLNPELYLNQLLECRQEYLDAPDKCAYFAPWSKKKKKTIE